MSKDASKVLFTRIDQVLDARIRRVLARVYSGVNKKTKQDWVTMAIQERLEKDERFLTSDGQPQSETPTPNDVRESDPPQRRTSGDDISGC